MSNSSSTPLIPAPGEINPALLKARWSAVWSRHPDAHVRFHQSGVFLFRRVFGMDDPPPATFIIHLSADQRYRLFVNGQGVCFGPARGDLLHTRFDSVDIAPFLMPGQNVLAVSVLYQNRDIAPVFQQTVEAALLVQGNRDMERRFVDTPAEWKVWHDMATHFSTRTADALHTYCVVGGFETVHTSGHPWGWETCTFDDSDWPSAQGIGRAAAPYEAADGETNWWLTPRTIPFMEETPQRFGRIVRVEGMGDGEIPGGFLRGDAPLTIAPHSRVTLLLDQTEETTAFPEIMASGGADATLEMAYAEALMDGRLTPWDAKRKTNRDDVGEPQILRGYADTWHLEGGTNRLLRPLWWRTFRFVQLTIETGYKPLTINDVRSVFTAYPFVVRSEWNAPEIPDLADINTIGWRTARLCAQETFTDCPYYEQLQYVGDTRIQALVTLYTSGDARLFRNALALFDASRIPDGLTQSRYPSRILQIIPPFSLWYIGMVRDYAEHVPGDAAFLRGLLPGVRGVLGWFRAHLRPDNLLGPLPWWNFVDWCPRWHMGVPPGASDTGGSSLVTLQYALALQDAARVFQSLGHETEAAQLQTEADAVARAVREHCYDAATFRVADTPQKQSFSQHAALLSVLAGAIPTTDFRPVMERILSDVALTQTTFYFRFYLTRALIKAGMGDAYLDTLGPWRTMMAQGLTTWAENPEPTRSDCHAWSSSPNYEFLATVLGIGPGSFGWETVRIAPHLGPLNHASGAVPHPKGEIRVALRRENDCLSADVVLPDNVMGTLVWRGREMALHGGPQIIYAE